MAADTQNQGNRQPEQSGSPEPQPQSPMQARAELLTEVQKEQLKKLEEEKSTKDRRRVALQTESQSGKSNESWVGKDKGSGALDGIAQSQIDSTVETEFSKKESDFAKYNILGANLAMLKQAAKDLVFDFYCKNGRDKGTTENWVNSTLTPRLTAIFDKMNTILADPKYGFKTPQDVLQSFSDFAQLDLISGGNLKLGSIKSFMVLNQSSVDTLSKNFEEYLNLGIDINRINGEIAKVTPGLQPPPTPNPAPPVQPIQPPPPAQQPPTVQQTPPTTPPTPDNPNKPPETVPAKVETQPPKPQETPPVTPPVAPPTTPTVAQPPQPEQPKQPEAPAEIKTGNAFLDTLIGFVKWLSPALYAQLGTWLGSMGLSGAAKVEFAGLDDNEKTEGVVLKEIAKTFDLKPEIMTKLFSDAEQMKRVIKNKNDNNVSDWETYFKTYLSSTEQQKLKTETTLSPKDIADILLSKVESGQTPSSKPDTIAPRPVA